MAHDGPMSEPGDDLPALTDRQRALAAQLHTSALDGLYAQRLELMRTLHRKGWTHPQLGRLLGLTKQRVQQLLRE